MPKWEGTLEIIVSTVVTLPAIPACHKTALNTGPVLGPSKRVASASTVTVSIVASKAIPHTALGLSSALGGKKIRNPTLPPSPGGKHPGVTCTLPLVASQVRQCTTTDGVVRRNRPSTSQLFLLSTPYYSYFYLELDILRHIRHHGNFATSYLTLFYHLTQGLKSLPALDLFYLA